jgi:hypothetical protein
MQLKAKHAIEDEERAEYWEALSHAQKEHPMEEDKQRWQEVYNSMVFEHPSFNFIKIHLMLHFEQSVQRFGHWIKGRTETKEMNHPTWYKGHYSWLNCNFWYKQQILNH